MGSNPEKDFRDRNRLGTAELRDIISRRAAAARDMDEAAASLMNAAHETSAYAALRIIGDTELHRLLGEQARAATVWADAVRTYREAGGLRSDVGDGGSVA